MRLYAYFISNPLNEHFSPLCVANAVTTLDKLIHSTALFHKFNCLIPEIMISALLIPDIWMNTEKVSAQPRGKFKKKLNVGSEAKNFFAFPHNLCTRFFYLHFRYGFLMILESDKRTVPLLMLIFKVNRQEDKYNKKFFFYVLLFIRVSLILVLLNNCALIEVLFVWRCI